MASESLLLEELDGLLQKHSDLLLARISALYAESSAPRAVAEGRRQDPSNKESIFGSLNRSSNQTEALPTEDPNFAQGRTLQSFDGGTDAQASLFDNEDAVRRTMAEAVSDWCTSSERLPGVEDSEQTALQKFVRSPAFEVFFAGAICMNSLLIGVTVERAAEDPGADTPIVVNAMNQCFTYLFLFELLLRISANGPRIFFFGMQWHWNCFDVLVVSVAATEVVMEYAGHSASSVSTGSNARLIRMVRAMRLLRVMRVLRVLRFVRALYTMVYSIFCTLKNVFWAVFLLTMLIYFFAIVFAETAQTHLLDNDFYAAVGALEQFSPVGIQAAASEEMLHYYWGSVTRAMFTLFKCITNGISWEVATGSLEEISTIWCIVFACFIFFTSFAIMNVITGVFCQSAIEAAKRDQETAVQAVLANKEIFIEQARLLFQSIDQSDDGRLTIREFEKHLKCHNVAAYLESLELSTHDAWTLFKLLDSDGTNEIDLDEFVVGCLKLKGGARSVDIAQIIHENKWIMKQLTSFIAFTKSQFASLRLSIDQVMREAEGGRPATTHVGVGDHELDDLNMWDFEL